MILGFSIVMTVAFLLAAPAVIRIFMAETAVVEAGSVILRCMVVTMPLMGVILVCTTLFQAAGKALSGLPAVCQPSGRGAADLHGDTVGPAWLLRCGAGAGGTDAITAVLAVVLLKRANLFGENRNSPGCENASQPGLCIL